MDKRKLEENEAPQKKFINEKEQLLYSTSDEWPIYYHPQGGYVKITPWGSVRITTNENGEIVQKFHDCSFDELDFTFPTNDQPQLPSTPQSINVTLSPDNEAESYVIDGFANSHVGVNQNTNNYGNNQANANTNIPTFTEHENYFGMNDDVEM